MDCPIATCRLELRVCTGLQHHPPQRQDSEAQERETHPCCLLRKMHLWGKTPPSNQPILLPRIHVQHRLTAYLFDSFSFSAESSRERPLHLTMAASGTQARPNGVPIGRLCFDGMGATNAGDCCTPFTPRRASRHIPEASHPILAKASWVRAVFEAIYSAELPLAQTRMALTCIIAKQHGELQYMKRDEKSPMLIADSSAHGQSLRGRTRMDLGEINDTKHVGELRSQHQHP